MKLIFLLTSISVLIQAQAQTVTSSMNINVNVVDDCIVSANDLDFGEYRPNAVLASEASSTINVRCTLGSAYEIALESGLNSPSPYSRQMSNGSANVTYQLYRDPARTLPWGNTALSDVIAGIGTGLNQAVPVYGRIPAGQNVNSGSYSDTVTVTVSF